MLLPPLRRIKMTATHPSYTLLLRNLTDRFDGIKDGMRYGGYKIS